MGLNLGRREGPKIGNNELCHPEKPMKKTKTFRVLGNISTW